MTSSIEFNADGYCQNSESLESLKSRMDASPQMVIDIPVIKQKRTHKNWRINKKWAKRFGNIIAYKSVVARVVTMKAEDYGKGLMSFEMDIDSDVLMKILK